MSQSLWGEEFVIQPTPKKAKKIVEKINTKAASDIVKSKNVKKDVSIVLSLLNIY